MDCKFHFCILLQSYAGASEGILVWYGQPSEVQFTREEAWLSRTCWEIRSQISVLLIRGVTGAKIGTVNSVVTVPCPTRLL